MICFLFILAEFSLFIQYAASKAQSYLQFLSIDVFGVFSRLPGAFRLKGIIEEFFTTACATKRERRKPGNEEDEPTQRNWIIMKKVNYL